MNESTDELGPLITVKKAAAKAAVSENHILRLARTPDSPISLINVGIGRKACFRVRERQLVNWLISRQIQQVRAARAMRRIQHHSGYLQQRRNRQADAQRN